MNSQISLFDGSVQFVVDKPVRLIELFAGIGSQAKALERLGVDFEHWRICEFDKYAVCAYNAIHGTSFEPSDITKLSGAELGIADTESFCYILTYSFPCQDLSKAGKGKGMEKNSGTRSGLLWEVERLLGEVDELPQVLLMENVPDVLGAKNAKHFYLWCQRLEEMGYRDRRRYGSENSRTQRTLFERQPGVLPRRAGGSEPHHQKRHTPCWRYGAGHRRAARQKPGQPHEPRGRAPDGADA